MVTPVLLQKNNCNVSEIIITTRLTFQKNLNLLQSHIYQQEHKTPALAIHTVSNVSEVMHMVSQIHQMMSKN